MLAKAILVLLLLAAVVAAMSVALLRSERVTPPDDPFHLRANRTRRAPREPR